MYLNCIFIIFLILNSYNTIDNKYTFGWFKRELCDYQMQYSEILMRFFCIIVLVYLEFWLDLMYSTNTRIDSWPKAFLTLYYISHHRKEWVSLPSTCDMTWVLPFCILQMIKEERVVSQVSTGRWRHPKILGHLYTSRLK